MVAQGLVWRVLEIQIEPANTAIMGTDNNIVALRMNADTGVDLSSTDQFFTHRLLLKVVYIGIFGGDKEKERLLGMEENFLYITFALLKGFLGFAFDQVMNQNLFVSI